MLLCFLPSGTNACCLSFNNFWFLHILYDMWFMLSIVASSTLLPRSFLVWESVQDSFLQISSISFDITLGKLSSFKLCFKNKFSDSSPSKFIYLPSISCSLILLASLAFKSKSTKCSISSLLKFIFHAFLIALKIIE